MKTMQLALFVALIPALPASAETRDRTVQEMVASVQAKSAKLDANRDGVLSPSETAKGREKFGMLAGAVESAVDANDDGVLTVKEYAGAQVEEIHRADRDHDGILTVAEHKKQKQALLFRLLGGG